MQNNVIFLTKTTFRYTKLLDWKAYLICCVNWRKKIKASLHKAFYTFDQTAVLFAHVAWLMDTIRPSLKTLQVYSAMLHAANSGRHLRLRDRVNDNVWRDSHDSTNKCAAFRTGVAVSYDVIFSSAQIISSGLPQCLSRFLSELGKEMPLVLAMTLLFFARFWCPFCKDPNCSRLPAVGHREERWNMTGKMPTSSPTGSDALASAW